MKKQLTLSAIVLTTVLVGSLSHSTPATACPFAQNRGLSGIADPSNSSFPLIAKKVNSNTMFSIAASFGLLVMGGIVMSRLNRGSQASTSEGQDDFVPSSFAIHVPPEALQASSLESEDIVSSRQS